MPSKLIVTYVRSIIILYAEQLFQVKLIKRKWSSNWMQKKAQQKIVTTYLHYFLEFCI